MYLSITFAVLFSPNVSKHEWQDILILKRNKDIIIKKADKGEAVVIMNIKHYLKMISDHLNDKTKMVFSCIRIGYEDLLRKSPYSVRIQENTDKKKLRIWTLFMQCCSKETAKLLTVLNIGNPKVLYAS